MHILVNNNAKLPNKSIRYAKWKFYQLAEKFKDLLYVEIFLNKEGDVYTTTIKLGVSGHDIILKHKNKSLNQLFKHSFDDVLRYLRKHKNKQLSY